MMPVRYVCLWVEFEWRHANVGGSGTSMKSLVPHSQDEIGIPDGQGACQMHGISSPKCVPASQMSGLLFDLCSQLHRPGSTPVLLPRLFGCGQIFIVEVMVTTSCRQCSAHLGIGEAAGEGGIASVPHLSSEVAAGLFDDQLHEGAGMEVDEWHASAPLLAYQR